MNYADLVNALAEKSGLTKKVSKEALDSLVAVMTEKLSEGEEIKIFGLGSFEVKERAARTGRNPRNPEETIEIPAKNALTFKASSQIKDALNNK